jgi:hypothetical protein
MTKKQFWKAVRKLENAWERKYRKEAKESDYATVEVYYDNDWTKKEIEQACRSKLQSQIDYITEMVSFQLWFGMASAPSNLARIRKFLNMQLQSHRKQNKPLYSITFHGGCSEHSVHVYAQRLGEVDFADSYDFLNFDIMQVSDFSTNQWTEKSVKDIIKQIKDDFAFDGYYPKIKVDGKMKEVLRKNGSLCLVCRME